MSEQERGASIMIWSNDRDRLRKLAARVPCGIVHIVHRLINDGCDVRGLDRDTIEPVAQRAEE